MNKALKMCMDWRVLAGIAVVVLVLWQFVPGAFAILPFGLFLIVCPLMMFLMMRGMGGMNGMSQSDAAPPATDRAMGGIAELKAEQAALAHQIADLEARPTPVPAEEVRLPAPPRGAAR